jgi:hypothetical protein
MALGVATEYFFLNFMLTITISKKIDITSFLPSKLLHNLFLGTFLVAKQQNNPRNKTLPNKRLKRMAESLPVTSLVDFCQKRSVKLLTIVKKKIYNIKKNSCNERTLGAGRK